MMHISQVKAKKRKCKACSYFCCPEVSFESDSKLCVEIALRIDKHCMSEICKPYPRVMGCAPMHTHINNVLFWIQFSCELIISTTLRRLQLSASVGAIGTVVKCSQSKFGSYLTNCLRLAIFTTFRYWWNIKNIASHYSRYVCFMT